MTTSQERFTEAYLEAMDFTELGESIPSCARLTALSKCNAINACSSFWRAYGDVLQDHAEQAGHDFWLTRQGHGTGFWDRPEVYGKELADQLTKACKAIGEVHEVDYGERWFQTIKIGSNFYTEDGICYVKTGRTEARHPDQSLIRFKQKQIVWGIGI